MVVSRARAITKRLVPLQCYSQDAVDGDRDVLVQVDPGAGIKIMHTAHTFVKRVAVTNWFEKFDAENCAAIAKRCFVTLAARIASRSKIDHAIRGYGIHGLCNDTVLEHRFIQIQQVVDDNIGASRRERSYGIGIVRFRGVAGVE